TLFRSAEVRCFVPAVPRRGQSVDHALEVILHRLRLAIELLTMRMREPRAGLRFELVARQVLRSESERLVDVGVEVGGARGRGPVDEIQRDVVKSGITEIVEGAPDVLRTGATLQYREQVRLKA